MREPGKKPVHSSEIAGVLIVHFEKGKRRMIISLKRQRAEECLLLGKTRAEIES